MSQGFRIFARVSQLDVQIPTTRFGFRGMVGSGFEEGPRFTIQLDVIGSLGPGYERLLGRRVFIDLPEEAAEFIRAEPVEPRRLPAPRGALPPHQEVIEGEVLDEE